MALGFAIAAVGLGWAMTPRGVDFAAFYSAGRAVWRGELRHVYDVGWIRAEQRGYSSQAYAYLYPPRSRSCRSPLYARYGR